MIVDDTEYKKWCNSRANLAFACGCLYGQLFQVKHVLQIEGEIDTGLKVRLTESITECLDEVSEILEREFYEPLMAKAKAPASPPAPAKEPDFP